MRNASHIEHRRCHARHCAFPARRHAFGIFALGNLRCAVALAACVLATFAGGCRSPSREPGSQPAGERVALPPQVPALGPVALPDLSGTARAAATQLREQYSVLKRKGDDPATASVDLANAYGQLGKLLMEAEYRDSAEACFFHAQALTPGDVRWPYYLGHLYRLKGETAKSAASFERVLQLRPDDEPTLVWLGLAYLDEGRPEAAEPMFTKALSIEPGAGPALFGMGRAALARRDYGRAVEYLEQTRSHNPKASIVHYPLAMAYRGLGRMQEADAHLRAKGAIEVPMSDPLLDELAGSVRSEFAYENLGVRAQNDGDFAESAAYFRQAVELAPDDPSFRHRLGTALALLGDVPHAVAEFQEVLRRSPHFVSTHYTLGVLLASSGHYDEAIDHFSAAVKSSPDYVEARLQLAHTLRRSGRLRESLSQYQQVATLDPRIAEGPLGYAMALVGLERYQEARDRLAEDIKVYPDRPAFAHALVRVLAAAPDDRVRDGRQAIALAQDLIAREQPNPDLGEAMAMAMAETGRYEDAVTWQRQAMTIAERSGRADLSKRMADNLTLFEHHQSPRRPWRHDDPVGGAEAAGSF
jgi:tetratricopeptide (TPR) repeat protein